MIDKRQAFTVRIDERLWKFLKKKAIDHKISSNRMVEECILFYKKNYKEIVDATEND